MNKFFLKTHFPLSSKGILPQGKSKVFQALVMGTSGELTAKENVEVIHKMEEVNLDVARRKGYVGIFSTNTSVLTQQLGKIYGFQTCVDYQINKYVDCDGTKPFGKAPDSQRVMVQWKVI